MAPRPRGKILCLGVSYASISDQLASLGRDFSDLEEDDPILPSHASADLCNTISCVRQSLLTQMDGRDLARVVETERVCKVDVYTVSQEKGAMYRSDRHYSGDFNNRKFVESLKDHFSGVVFDQILLDYFWIPTGWDRQHWSRSFFENTLVSFAKQDLLSRDAKLYIPFCLHCFKEMLICQNTLLKHYNISFLRKKELKEVALWKGTQNIDHRIMQGVLGKRLDQEEVYCTFGPKTISEDGADSYITTDDVRQFCRQLDDFADIRFIVLQALPKSTCNKTRRHQELTKSMGQILGLVDPGRVRNGFDLITSVTSVAPKDAVSRRKRHAATERKAVTKRRVTVSPRYVVKANNIVSKSVRRSSRRAKC